MEGRKSLVSYYIYFGSESKEDWLHLKLPIEISFRVILSSLRFGSGQRLSAAKDLHRRPFPFALLRVRVTKKGYS